MCREVGRGKEGERAVSREEDRLDRREVAYALPKRSVRGYPARAVRLKLDVGLRDGSGSEELGREDALHVTRPGSAADLETIGRADHDAYFRATPIGGGLRRKGRRGYVQMTRRGWGGGMCRRRRGERRARERGQGCMYNPLSSGYVTFCFLSHPTLHLRQAGQRMANHPDSPVPRSPIS